ncbi:hypothetical protein [Streptomyces avermitilis]|uniref:hypothetical protein n=1 Tax=Streptomyces avermitilis TaxID=33903 RepID=UPI003F4B49E6
MAAACVCGALDLADGARIVALRAREIGPARRRSPPGPGCAWPPRRTPARRAARWRPPRPGRPGAAASARSAGSPARRRPACAPP